MVTPWIVKGKLKKNNPSLDGGGVVFKSYYYLLPKFLGKIGTERTLAEIPTPNSI
jgi:hypothetical protein